MGAIAGGLGRGLRVLVPFLRGHASGGLSAGLAAMLCSVGELSAADTLIITTAAGSAGQWLAARFEDWKARRLLPGAYIAGPAPGSLIDASAGVKGGQGSLPAYLVGIARYCGHDGAWHPATIGCRTIGHAKGGGWWKAETLDGRVYDCDGDTWT